MRTRFSTSVDLRKRIEEIDRERRRLGSEKRRLCEYLKGNFPKWGPRAVGAKAAIKVFISKTTGPFDAGDIARWLKENMPSLHVSPSAISMTLKRLHSRDFTIAFADRRRPTRGRYCRYEKREYLEDKS